MQFAIGPASNDSRQARVQRLAREVAQVKVAASRNELLELYGQIVGPNESLQEAHDEELRRSLYDVLLDAAHSMGVHRDEVGIPTEDPPLSSDQPCPRA